MSGTGRPTDADEGDGAARYTPRPLRERLRLRSNPELLVGLTLLLGYAAVALGVLAWDRGTVPWLDPQASLLRGVTAPTGSHPFGILEIQYLAPTAPAPGQYGVDELDALLDATPGDLGLFGLILVPSALVGAVLGAWAGSSEGGVTDLATTAWGDVLIGVPPFLLVAILFGNLALLVPSGDSLYLFAVVYLLVLWPYYARPVRAQARLIAAEPYVQAAEAAGATRRRILSRHILPNSLSPLLAQLPADLAGVFLLLTAFAYVGCRFPLFGTVAFTPSWRYPEWGYELAQGACNGLTVTFAVGSWWMYAIPLAVVVLFGVAVALTCDGLQRQLEHGRPSR